jgi:hypothetical protein
MTTPYIPPPVNDYEPRPISPLSDPHGSGLLGHSGAPLMNRPPRAPRAHDMGLPSSSGGGSISGIHDGGGDGSSGFDLDQLNEDLKAKADDDEESGVTNEQPSRPVPVNDADHPMARGGIFSDGVNLHHIRPMTGPSSGGSTGTGYGATHVGAPGDGAV